jgi:HK97 family phage portal protein
VNALELIRKSVFREPVQSRVTEFGDSSIPTWRQASGSMSTGGVLVTQDKAVGLSAVAQAIRQPAVLAAGLPLDVYDVSQDRKTRMLSAGKWQNRLLDQPDSTRPGFDFWSDLFSHIDGFANAVAVKVKDGGRVVELVLLDPERVTLEIDPKTRDRTYCYWRKDGGKVEIPGSEVLHVRGWDDRGAPWARSAVERHRDALAKTAGRQAYVERYLANDASPGMVFVFPGAVTREQAREFLDVWEDNHRANPGRPGVLGGGADIKDFPISLRDLQFIETEQFAISDIARIFDWPADLLGRETERPFVEVMAWAVRLHLMPRLQRVEAALGDDPDLFGVTSKFRPYHDVSELLRGDVATTADVFHQLRQVGVLTANEVRLPLGFPPIDGGDELLMTPVGGAPNNGGPPSSDEPDPATGE